MAKKKTGPETYLVTVDVGVDVDGQHYAALEEITTETDVADLVKSGYLQILQKMAAAPLPVPADESDFVE